MTLSKKEEASVLQVYKTYFDSYTSGDVENIASLLTESYTQIGSAEAEVFANKKDAVKFLHDTIDQVAGKAEMRNRVLKAQVLDGYVLIIDLFDMYVLMEDEWSFYAKLRASTLMQKTDSGWKFVYQHSSMPDTRAEDGNNLAIEKISAENQQLREAVKRRTIELEGKNRELEIEAALERVRNKAIAMRSSEELADLVVTVFRELQEMDMALTRCLVWLFNEEDQSAEVWMANSEDPNYADSYHIPNHNHPAYKRFLKGWRSQESKWEYHLKGKNKASWDEILVYGYFKRLPNKVKKAMKAPEQIILSGSFNKYGVIQTAGLNVLSNENQEILQRFSQVFEQTYSRFLDLQKAEAQAREAQIEAALEKVRSRSLAMHKSDELNEVVSILFERLKELQILATAVGIAINIDGSKDLNGFVCGENEDGLVITNYRLPYFDNKISKDISNVLRKQLGFFVGHYSIEEKNSFYEYLLEYTAEFRHLPEDIKRMIFESPLYTISMVAVKNAVFNINDFEGKVLSKDEIDIIKRFARVFEQTYTRFLDLQKAEAQAREAQIEAALERVRAKAMAMHNTRDLTDTINVFYEQIGFLSESPRRCGIDLIDKETHAVRISSMNTSEQGQSVEAEGQMILKGHPVLEDIYDYWVKQEEYFPVLKGKELKEYYEFVRPYVGYPDYQTDIAHYGHFFSFSEGCIYVWTTIEMPDEELKIYRRFTSVLSLTYNRFNDLQKAEAQAREAQIEAALERVRSKTMAMHNSHDVGVTVVTLFDEVIKLGLDKSIRCGIGILEGTEGMETWSATSSPNNKVDLKMGMLDMTIHPMLIGLKKAWQSGKTGYSYDYIGKDVTRYYNALNNEPEYPFFVELDTLPENEFHNSFFFSEGIIFAFTEIPISEEAAIVLNRFAHVFGQTYRRYLDLQKAESQAREAQIEAALERVRARALAMQQPDELMEVAKVLRQEMGVLGVEELETSSIYINDEQAERAECWYALKDIRKRKKRLVSDHFALDLNDTWVGRQMLKFYKTENERTSIVMKGKNRIEWIRYCEEKSVPFRGYYGDVIPDRTYHLFKFSHGAVGAATPGDISDEHWGLLKRAAAVFSLAYSRFKDLSQAREDLQKLKEEKRRAENALTELKSTQSQLIHAEKMASLGELTAGIAHEIQNPLNFVNNFSEVSGELVEEINEELKVGNLEDVEEITVDLKQNLEKINHHGQRASGIVKGMLEHSRTGSGEKELTDINKLADEYLRLSYHGLRAKDKSFNADFKADFDENLPKVNVIVQDLGRVILNLINNALYAVSEKAKSVDDDKYKPLVKVSTKKLSAAVEVIVQDNGQGIPKEIVDKIFQPFFTTKPTGSGTGLGLSMSYDIISKGHGGELKVRTVEGVGTEFIIILPY